MSYLWLVGEVILIAAISLLTLWLTVGLAVRSLARKEILWFFVPANTWAALVSKDNKSTDMTKGGGGIVGMAHEIPGRKIKWDADPMNWQLVREAEDRGLLHKLYGVHWKGLFKDVRLNVDRTFRFGRKEGETDYRIFPQDLDTKYIYFSGQQAVVVKKAETAGAFALDLRFNLIFERIFPVRALIRVADSNATLSEMVESKATALTAEHDPDFYLAGKEEDRKKLSMAVGAISSMPQSDVPVMGSTEDQLGVSITLVTLFSIDPDEEERGLRALLELKKKTELEQAARVQVANTDAEVKVIEAKADKEVAVLAGQAEKEVGILVNDVAADKVTRVVLPIAQTPGGPQVRFAEAYEKNETVTIFAPGGDGMGLIIQPEKK